MDGKLILNPNAAEREASSLALTVASTAKKVVMIEAGADQVPEDVMFDAIMLADAENRKIVEFINGMVAEVGKEKFAPAASSFDEEL